MNQILEVGTTSNKGRTKAPVEIGKIIKFFAISMIIFGLFMVGSGTYAMYKFSEVERNVIIKPEIEEISKGEDKILLRVKHRKEIKTVEYSWNDEAPNVINGNGRKSIEQEIVIPGGKNTLNVKAIDVDGQEISQPKEYIAPDIIKLELAMNKLIITAENEEEISYMTYRWNNEDEQKIDINSNVVNQEIEIPKGDNTITIVLVDRNNKTIMKKQKIKGVMKPTIGVTLDDNKQYFVIKASDENGLDKIEFTITNSKISGKKYRLRANNKEKELEYKYKLEEGINYIEASSYSVDGVKSDTKKAKATK